MTLKKTLSELMDMDFDFKDEGVRILNEAVHLKSIKFLSIVPNKSEEKTKNIIRLNVIIYTGYVNSVLHE